MPQNGHTLTLTRLGIDTYNEAVVYMQKNCEVCRSEGFEVHARIRVSLGDKSVLATLNTIENGLLGPDQVSLSEYAWKLLGAKEGDTLGLVHPKPLQSLSFVRAKVYGQELSFPEIDGIIRDISQGNYSDIHIATFLTACSAGRLNSTEIVGLTKSMVSAGEQLTWGEDLIVDKHCVGGLPGNRTTLIIVPIVTAFGLMMPKTSSRAITSPAGTADTMETLAPVDLDLPSIRRVVEQEQGCIVWGGGVALSPADDIMIQVERVMDLDSEGQLIASVLSKKIAAGSNHIVVDIPVGPTAKVRTVDMAHNLRDLFILAANVLGIKLHVIISDGSQPVGRGIGPALEARDVLAVLQNQSDAPQDLREHALQLAGATLEFSPKIPVGKGYSIAKEILTDGRAWKKFQAICDAQGGMRELTTAKFTHTIESPYRGRVTAIDNRQLARIAKLAGAPHDQAAGVLLHTPLNRWVQTQEPLFTVHAESKGELNYALSLLERIPPIIQVEPCE